MSSQTFPFFDLPDLVITEILKRFVSVPEKAYTLSTMPEFKPYLERRCLWFKSSLNFYKLLKCIQPGWYVNRDHYYHVSIGEDCIVMRHFNSCLRHVSRRMYSRKFETTVPVAQNFLSGVCRKNNHRNEQSVVNYTYRGILQFWIDYEENVLHWFYGKYIYPLNDNQCIVPDHTRADHIRLTTDADRSCILECVHPGVVHCCSLSENVIRPNPKSEVNECSFMKLSLTDTDVNIDLVCYCSFDKCDWKILLRDYFNIFI